MTESTTAPADTTTTESATTPPAAKPLPKFRFTVSGLCAAEQALGAKLGAIVAEAASTEGMSLRTLRALVAAGLEPKSSAPIPAAAWFDEAKAARLIAKHGIEACATAIAVPLAVLLGTVR